MSNAPRMFTDSRKFTDTQYVASKTWWDHLRQHFLPGKQFFLQVLSTYIHMPLSSISPCQTPLCINWNVQVTSAFSKNGNKNDGHMRTIYTRSHRTLVRRSEHRCAPCIWPSSFVLPSQEHVPAKPWDQPWNAELRSQPTIRCKGAKTNNSNEGSFPPSFLHQVFCSRKQEVKS